MTDPTGFRAEKINRIATPSPGDKHSTGSWNNCEENPGHSKCKANEQAKGKGKDPTGTEATTAEVDATKGGTDHRPDICQLVCIDQKTQLATARTFDTGEFFTDRMNESRSQMAADVWNAVIGFGKAWSEISIFSLGGAGEVGPAIATKVLNLGSAGNAMSGAINLDIRALSGVNVVADAKALPFANKVFDSVHAINPHGFNPVSLEVARVMKPDSLLYVTGTAKNGFARAMSDTEAFAAGFRVIGTKPMIQLHNFGVQRATTGGTLNTNSSMTTIYQVIR